MAERRNPNAKANTQLLDLPSEVLIQILLKLDNSELKPLTLVSKSFRSLADQLVRKLNFNVPPDPPLRNILSRFTSVSQISLSFHNPLAAVLLAISESRLKIEVLELRRVRVRPFCPTSLEMISLAGRFGTVKVLRLDWFESGEELQAVEFVHLFPSLEELDLSFCHNWTDAGIKKLELASAVPNLRKIDTSHNKLLTDHSFNVLSNCVNLEHLSFEDCELMTAEGFCRFVLNRRNLTWIKLPHHFSCIENWGALVQTISVCENLSHLSINGHHMPNSFLLSVAKLRFPLTSLKCYIYSYGNAPSSMAGLSAMLSAFQGLTTLHIILIEPIDDTQDMKMSQLVKSLSCLKNFFLVWRHNGYATLFSVIHHCPLLESIFIHSFGGLPPPVVPQLIRKNYSIKSIILLPAPNPLKAVLEPICPSVKKWD